MCIENRAFQWENACHSKLCVYAGRRRKTKGFKGKKMRMVTHCFEIIILTTKVNNKGDVSSRLDRQLLGRCPHRSIFLGKVSLCSRLRFLQYFVIVFIIRHSCMTTLLHGLPQLHLSGFLF